MYLYSANTRINLTCPECSEVGISMEVNHYEKEFVILVVLMPRVILAAPRPNARLNYSLGILNTYNNIILK